MMEIDAYLTVNRISRSDDAAPRVQTGVNTGLCDRHCLLFHDFVDGDAIDIGHLVEFIDTYDTTIGENHSSRLESALSSVLVGGYGRGQTHTRASATSCCDSERRGAEHEAEHLRLRGGWVTNH